MKEWRIVGLALGLLLVSIACAGGDTHEELPLMPECGAGTVEDVRILSRISERVEGGSGGVSGALIGGMLAGGVGAVVGAEATREPARLITTTDTNARVVIQRDDGARYVVTSAFPDLLLLRTGDRVRFDAVRCSPQQDVALLITGKNVVRGSYQTIPGLRMHAEVAVVAPAPR
ncbi:hypothetical protein HY480_04940 [Candidatus Uhrbacteria bacterium]|nr:hypothetical protein [Candidatus Uhrbacteria bacterium]